MKRLGYATGARRKARIRLAEVVAERNISGHYSHARSELFDRYQLHFGRLMDATGCRYPPQSLLA